MSSALAAIQALRLLSGPAVESGVRQALGGEEGELRQCLGMLLPHLDMDTRAYLRKELGVRPWRGPEEEGPQDFDTGFGEDEEAEAGGGGGRDRGAHLSNYFAGRGDLDVITGLREKDDDGSEEGPGGRPRDADLAEELLEELMGGERRDAEDLAAALAAADEGIQVGQGGRAGAITELLLTYGISPGCRTAGA